MLPLDPQAQNSAPVPQGLGPVGSAPAGLGPLGLGPVGQVRIYLGSAHRFIWPVHLAGWLDLGWTTEPGANGPGVAPRATPTVTSAPRKKRASSSPSPSGVSSATAVEPLPVLVTDFLVDPSVPTDA